DRHAGAVCCHKQASATAAALVLARRQVLADEIMKLRRPERLLERRAAAQRAVEAIRAEQVFVIEDDVINSDHLVLAQLEIVQERPRLVHLHAECERSEEHTSELQSQSN